MNHRLRHVVVLFTLLIALPLTRPSLAFATERASGRLARISHAEQVTTSTLAGRILDSSGGALPGVAVIARQTETGLQRSTTSDTQGRYTVPALPPGTYEIRAELAGFRPLLRSGVTLTIAQTAVVNLTMAVGGVAEAVTVVGDASTVNTRSVSLTGRSRSSGEELLPDLPVLPVNDVGSVPLE